MERDEFKVLVKGMKAVYAQPTFIPDQDAFNVWFGLLGDLPYDVANVAIQKYMISERFPPTIADIRTKATEILSQSDDFIGDMEAWSMVYRAICNSGYHAVEEFEKLPLPVQRAVGSPDNLREWSMADTKIVDSTVQARFLDSYKVIQKRMKEEAQIPEKIRLMIENIREQNRPPEVEQKQEPLIEEKEEPETIYGEMPEGAKKRYEEMTAKWSGK